MHCEYCDSIKTVRYQSDIDRWLCEDCNFISHKILRQQQEDEMMEALKDESGN